jgi:plastocyanin
MKRVSVSRLQALGLAVIGLLIGCGGGGGTPPSIINIAKVAGDGQSAMVGQPLAEPLTVVVTDGGTPSAGTTVTWSTTTAGGSLVPNSGLSDADGHASTSWTLGTVSGPQQTAATLSGGSLTTFTATAAPDAAITLSKAGGDNQTGTIGTPLATPVQAKVSDQFGNGVAGVNVAWSASGGTVSAGAIPTNVAGISPVQVTLGATAGPVTITATADPLSGSPLTFNATAQVAPPIPTTAAVRVGNNSFTSVHNGTVNPAVDTVAVGGTVTWTWTNTGITQHSVQSLGTPSFTSSGILSVNGATYQFTFPSAGTYQYDCVVHGTQMTGRIVVR